MFTLPPPRLARGFTTIELMVTVAVLGVLAAIAAPSFTPLIERWQVRQVSEELQSTLYFARSEAVKRGGGIGIQRSASTDDCTITNSDADLWNCGWVVFVDKNNNGARDTEEVVLQITPPSNRVQVKFTRTDSSSLTQPVLANRWGQLSSDSTSNFVVRITTKGSNTEASASSLCVNGSGKIQRLNSSTATCA